MRYLFPLLLFIQFIVVINLAHAGSFMSKGDISKNNAGQPGVTVYPLKGRCEQRKAEKCFQIDGKNLNYYAVTLVTIDDHSKPIWEAKSNITPCTDEIDCYSKLVVDYCDALGPDYLAFVNEGFTEIYCTKVIGYEQMQVEQLIEDPTLKAADDAKEAAKVAKEAAKDAAKSRIGGCVALLEGSNNIPDLRECLRDLLISSGY